jgi:hypothetical protein
MSGSPRRNNPFKSLLPRIARDSTIRDRRRVVLVKRAPEGQVSRSMLDGLDAFVLACAEQELTIEALAARLPCATDAAIQRIERLVALGAMSIWQEVRVEDETLPGGDVEDPHTSETVRPRKNEG